MGASGPQCGTIGSPADQPGVIGVGATLSDDSVSTSASKGPALDGSIKPDLVVNRHITLCKSSFLQKKAFNGSLVSK